MERCEKNKAQFVSLIGVRFEFDGMIAQTPASRVHNAYSAEIRRVLLAANAQENGLACAVGARRESLNIRAPGAGGRVSEFKTLQNQCRVCNMGNSAESGK